MTKKNFDDIMGAKLNQSNWFTQAKNERAFDDYINKIETKQNENGIPFIFVNRRLVSLGEGCAFGEVALLSNVNRMASVRTTKPTILATIKRHEFSIVFRKVMKRKRE